MFKHILVTVDGSEASEAVLPQVIRAALPETPVTILTVAEAPPAVVQKLGPSYAAGAPDRGGVATLPGPTVVENRDQAISRVREEQTAYLESLATPLRAAGLPVEARVEFGNPAEEILSFARREDVDLIAMATHGRGALAHLVFGSVAARVIAGTGTPVLLVHPR